MQEAVALWLLYALIASALSLALGIARRVSWLVPAAWFVMLGLGWKMFGPIFSQPAHAPSIERAIWFLISVVVAVILTARNR